MYFNSTWELTHKPKANIRDKKEKKRKHLKNATCKT